MNRLERMEKMDALDQQITSLIKEREMLKAACQHVGVVLTPEDRNQRKCLICGEPYDGYYIDAAYYYPKYNNQPYTKLKIVQRLVKSILRDGENMTNKDLVEKTNFIIREQIEDYNNRVREYKEAQGEGRSI